MGKSRKLRQNKKNGRKSFSNLMTKSRKMMMTPFKNNFTRKIFGGANKTWVVTLETDEAGSTPKVNQISVGNDKDGMKDLSYNTLTQRWGIPPSTKDKVPPKNSVGNDKNYLKYLDRNTYRKPDISSTIKLLDTLP